MKVMGVNAIHTLVLPRVLAATFIAAMLSSLVVLVGLTGGFSFAVLIQHVTPGSLCVEPDAAHCCGTRGHIACKSCTVWTQRRSN